ncbi:glycosyltransferase [Tieghemostelium lacteum]|uniref:Fucosyltransferase n=1 Tax=Tieghemostelium lacteum TaxID=361077 RepID=A0A152A3Y3_TIELA|nr:glycosyltransferase [Tieghemostelium lacteum]|eukprot:KYR00795.1 glycosyltransferase [Tieghemostelium lacteum]
MKKQYILVFVYISLALYCIHTFYYLLNENEINILEIEENYSKQKNESQVVNAIILSWNKGYKFINAFQNCRELGCRITNNRKIFPKADAVLFSVSNNRINSIPPRRFSDQIYIGFSFEATTYYKYSRNQTFIKENFNMTAGFKYVVSEPSHVYVPYGPISFQNSPGYVFKYEEPIKEIPKDDREKKILFAASNCNTPIGRNRLVTELMGVMEIDSIGKCLNNQKVGRGDQKIGAQGKGEIKMELLKKYKFSLAIENSECEDYVTEKLWEPLSVGTIPIYLGAPNIDRFLPSPDAIINVRDFDSAQSLADYVRLVDTNETLRRKHLKWIEEPWSESYQQLYNDSLDHSDMFCSICKKLLNHQKEPEILQPIDWPFTQCSMKPFIFPTYSNDI